MLCTRRGTQTLTSFPRSEVSPHQEIVEARDTNQLQQLREYLLHYTLLHVEALQALPNLVEEVENIVHAVRRCGVCVQDPVEQPSTSVCGREAGQTLAFNQCRDSHLRQLLLRLGHPGVVDVVLEAVQIVLDH